VLGGQENAIAIARSLGRRGIRVTVSSRSHCLALRSRFCSTRLPVPDDVPSEEYWQHLLLDRRHPGLEGCVVLACSDEALEFIAAHQRDLETRYVLEENVPSLRRALLDKQRTMELARQVGIPVPSFWNAASLVDVERLAPEVSFPAMIKPVHSHRFQRLFEDEKYLRADSREDLLAAARAMLARDLQFLVCELVPGPDRLLSSYYTYIDEHGEALFRLTKSVLRRHPMNMGGACYHLSEWLPETADLGERFFRGVGLTGLGNVEFKRDPRDGKLKLIESNARFTAAQELLVRCGMDTAVLVYDHLVGRPAPRIREYRQNLRLWYPRQDFAAFRQLRGRGELGFIGWLRSIAHRQVFPYFALTDPWPSVANAARYLGHRLRKALRPIEPAPPGRLS
jgi:D-aspartate ligase